MSARKQGREGIPDLMVLSVERSIPPLFSPPVSLWFGAGGLPPFPKPKESQMITYIHFIHLPDDSLWGIFVTVSYRKPPLPPGIRRHSLITTVHFGSLLDLWKHNVWHKFPLICPSGL